MAFGRTQMVGEDLSLAGTRWYFQFFFYTIGRDENGQGRLRLRKLDAAHGGHHHLQHHLGWIFHEWKGASKKAHSLIATGIATLILSTIIIGIGTALKAGFKF